MSEITTSPLGYLLVSGGRRGRVMTLFLTAIPMASVFGGPLSGWILSAVSGSYGYSGWQGLFFVEAVPSLVFGVAILFYLHNRVEEADDLTKTVELGQPRQNWPTAGALESPFDHK
jgi:MFS family permease